MSAVDWINIRIFFSKTGRAKYISHLDTMRTLTRAFKRSGLPFWYTQGFNPHLYMTFALPLALGTESRCESLDARFTAEIPWEQAEAKLAASLPPGFEVQRIRPPQMDPNDIHWADYRIALQYGDNVTAMRDALAAFLDGDQIEVVKKTKKTEKTIDLRPCLQVLSLDEDGGEVRLHIRLRAGNHLNIAPKLLLDAFQDSGAPPPRSTSILRVGVLDEKEREFA